MTPLPERKKTAEELAQLRESPGVPDELAPGAPGAAGRERVELPKAKQKAPTPADEAHGAEPKPAERSKSASPEAGVPAGAPSAPSGPKPVRSLRRSEREPRELPPRTRKPPPDSKLPVHKHSDAELRRIRDQNAMLAKPPVERINAQAGHWSLIGFGYLLALAGGIGGLAVALFLFLKKPRSTHHAAWMTVIAVLVLVFGILYLLPKTDGP